MILAIDLGSTSFKAGVYDGEAACLGRGSSPLSYDRPQAGHVELSADTVDEAATSAISRALVSAAVGADVLSAVAVTSQAQTFCVWQDACRTPFISWQDARASGDLAALRTLLPDSAFGAETGFGVVIPGLCVATAYHLRALSPSPLAGGARIVHLPEYLVWRMTGEWLLDRNLAAMSGLYSLSAGDWWDAALGAVGVTAGQLPALVEAGAVAGYTGDVAWRGVGLPAGLRVILAGNDQSASAFGGSLHQTRATLITLGTAQVVYQHARTLPPPRHDRARGIYPGGGYYQMWADSCGGNLVTWAHSVLGTGSDIDSFFAAASRSDPGCGGVRFEWDPRAGTGRWLGAGAANDPGDRARSVLQFLCDRVKNGIACLSPAEGYSLAGGGARSALWRQMLSDTLGAGVTPVRTSPLDGAARMARAALT